MKQKRGIQRYISLFPAHAGMIPRAVSGPMNTEPFPCACRDDPPVQRGADIPTSFSLRMQG